MELPWYPWYPGDYAADTADLSCCEHGCYRLLLDAFWARGPLPDDLNRLQRLAANCDAETVRFILERYWQRTNAGWISPRLEKIRRKQLASHKVRVKAGQKGGRKKAENQSLASNAKAMLEQCSSNQNQNQIQNQEEEDILSRADAQDAPQPEAKSGRKAEAYREAAEILVYLNERAGKAYHVKDKTGKWTGHVEAIRARVAEYGAETVKAVIDRKVAEWQSDEKMRAYLRPGTLFAKSKFENYAGDAASPPRAQADRPIYD